MPAAGCSKRSAEVLRQCERNPLCQRGFKHGGKGGHCALATAGTAGQGKTVRSQGAADITQGPSSVGGRGIARIANSGVNDRSSVHSRTAARSPVGVGELCLWRDASGKWRAGSVAQLRADAVEVVEVAEVVEPLLGKTHASEPPALHKESTWVPLNSGRLAPLAAIHAESTPSDLQASMATTMACTGCVQRIYHTSTALVFARKMACQYPPRPARA